MELYRIEGGRPLGGSVVLPPAKNSVLPLLAASLLCGGPVLLRNVPRTADAETSLALLRVLGAGAEWTTEGVWVKSGEKLENQLPQELASAMRSSVFYLAPLLHRTGRVTMPLPGGCRLGPRLIDIHLDGLSRMGARLSWQQRTLTLAAPRRLCGVDYTLRMPSVGATESLMMAAALARGGTILRGVACEPEVADLAAFLNACGADIHGAGTPTIRVRGVEELGGTDFTPLPDRIIGATLVCAAAAAGGRVRLENGRMGDMRDSLTLLRRMGCAVFEDDGITVERDGILRPVGMVSTGAWPGFATDCAPLLAAALLTAGGESTIRDTLFEKRFACAAGFAAMGANVAVEGRQLTIRGVEKLRGARVKAPDLRGGAALILAALGAEGVTLVEDAGHIRRGYPSLEKVLCELGAAAKKNEAAEGAE